MNNLLERVKKVKQKSKSSTRRKLSLIECRSGFLDRVASKNKDLSDSLMGVCVRKDIVW